MPSPVELSSDSRVSDELLPLLLRLFALGNVHQHIEGSDDRSKVVEGWVWIG
jgi:hypothetical protein